MLVLFGGPAGAGKSTLARAWCGTRERAVHIELDLVSELIVSGRADPQQPGALQTEQYSLSVAASIRLAQVFLAADYDVAIDDVLTPTAFGRYWAPLLVGVEWRVIIVLPSLSTTLTRSAQRSKRVLEMHSRDQHAASAGWGSQYRIDTTDLGIEESLQLAQARIAEQIS